MANRHKTPPKPRRLGRGLSGLLDEGSVVHVTRERVEPVVPRGPEAARVESGGAERQPVGAAIAQIGIAQVKPNKYQPRQRFDDASLAELAASIREHGLLQPIMVRPMVGELGYELVAGERRLRAARLAGLERIPAIIRAIDDRASAEAALIENVQREDLNPVERARAFSALIERFGLTQAEVAQRVGLDRSSVANIVRLLDLEPEILEMLETGALSLGHGKALLSLPSGEGRVARARQAAEEGWNVRRLESPANNDITNQTNGVAGPVKSPAASDFVRAELERSLGDHMGTKVLIRTSANGKRGRVVIEFYSLDHLDGILAKMGYRSDEALVGAATY